MICLGLALATQQPAWLFLPFEAILIWEHRGLKEAIGRLSMAGGIALAINLPFIVWNFHAWLAGVLAPVADPMYPSGVGVVALGLTPIFPLLPAAAYTALEALAMLFCIAWYWRICKSRPEAAMLLAVQHDPALLFHNRLSYPRLLRPAQRSLLDMLTSDLLAALARRDLAALQEVHLRINDAIVREGRAAYAALGKPYPGSEEGDAAIRAFYEHEWPSAVSGVAAGFA